MDKHTLLILFFFVISVLFLFPGISGFITGEMRISSKYYRMTYTGTKAVVMGFGYVFAGLTGLLLTALIALKPTVLSSQIMVIALIVAGSVLVLSGFAAWIVPGKVIKERRGLRWF